MIYFQITGCYYKITKVTYFNGDKSKSLLWNLFRISLTTSKFKLELWSLELWFPSLLFTESYGSNLKLEGYKKKKEQKLEMIV